VVALQAAADNETVWWAADTQAGCYYDVPLQECSETNGLITLVSPTDGDLDAERSPDVVILSKPDIYDAEGSIREYLSSRGFGVSTSLTAFTIWERR